MPQKDIDRIKTGIPGFDDIISGGIPRKAIVLLSGSPGTGKTLFALQALVNGCKQGEKGMFITFEQSTEDLISQAKLLGWEVEEYISSGKLIIQSVDALTDSSFLEKLPSQIEGKGLSTLVIDSITALQNSPAMMRGADIIRVIASGNNRENSSTSQMAFHEATIRRLSVHYLMSILRKLFVTAFVISDIKDDANQLSSDGISEFLADGIIVFYYVGISGEEARSLQVRKMRWTKQKKGYFPFEIQDNGILVQSEGSTVMMK